MFLRAVQSSQGKTLPEVISAWKTACRFGIRLRGRDVETVPMGWRTGKSVPFIEVGITDPGRRAGTIFCWQSHIAHVPSHSDLTLSLRAESSRR